MTLIAFLTCQRFPQGFEDDLTALEPLRRHGIEVQAAVWDDPKVDWESFEAIIIRSTWDYYQQPEAFRAWLDQIEARGMTLLNPVDLIRWNMDKRYLRELQGRGITVIPSEWVDPGAPVDLRTVLQTRGWSEAVIKPAVSAGAWQTQRVSLSDLGSAQVQVDQILQDRAVIIQQFRPEVMHEGEWSFLFFNGVFSHAVLKQPPAGDFRVQAGTMQLISADPTVLKQAQAVVGALDMPPLYARVDGVISNGEFQLMELEVFEPCLYLRTDPTSAQRFADAVAARVQVPPKKS